MRVCFLLTAPKPLSLSIPALKDFNCAPANDGRRPGKILPLGGSFPTTKFRVDGKSAEKALGFEFTNYEETMKGLIAQYIELKKMATAS